MWNQLFWFSQPSIVLQEYDMIFFWVFVGLAASGLILKLTAWMNKHAVNRKLINKFGNLDLWTGLLGLVWFALRYENTPIFSFRAWVGVIAIIFVVWLAIILKYVMTNYFEEKKDFDKVLLNSRYIPNSKR